MGGSTLGRQRSMYNVRRKRRRFPVVLPINSNRLSTSTARAMGFRSRSGSSTMMSNSRGYAIQKIRAGSGSTFSSYKSKMRPHPRAYAVKRVGSPQFYSIIDTVRVSNSNYGQQAFTDFTFADSDNLKDMVTQVSGYNNTTDIFLEKLLVELTFTNQAETTTYIDIYEVTPRYAVNTSPATNVGNGLIDQSGGTGSFTNIGATPLMSRQFTSLWKVHKKYSFELAQGQSHSHKATYLMNQKWNEELYNIYGTGYFLRNFNKSVIIVARGVPINDQTSKTSVATSQVAVDVIAKQSYYWFYNNPTNSLYKYTNNQGTITTGYVLDIGSGEAEAINVA